MHTNWHEKSKALIKDSDKSYIEVGFLEKYHIF